MLRPYRTQETDTMPYKPEIHHRNSIRLRGYDYTQTGEYFVTICTFDRECLFGEVVGGEMRLNDQGHAVLACWAAIPDHSPHVFLDVFAVMPNHLHGILTFTDLSVPALVGAQHAAPLQGKNVNPGSLGAVVRSFKSAVSKRINQMRNNPGQPVWQRNYYEHVIRNDDDLAKIRQYIADNPMKWDLDENNPANAGMAQM